MAYDLTDDHLLFSLPWLGVVGCIPLRLISTINVQFYDRIVVLDLTTDQDPEIKWPRLLTETRLSGKKYRLPVWDAWRADSIIWAARGNCLSADVQFLRADLFDECHRSRNQDIEMEAWTLGGELVGMKLRLGDIDVKWRRGDVLLKLKDEPEYKSDSLYPQSRLQDEQHFLKMKRSTIAESLRDIKVPSHIKQQIINLFDD